MTTAAILASTDSFSDVWPAALACIDKFWKDCPWKIYTTSERKPWGKNPILIGPDYGWVNNLRIAIDLVDAEFVCLFLEDMILVRKVDTERCELMESLMVSYPELGAVRLGQGGEETNGGFVNALLDQFLCPVAGSSPYRISTSPTLWRVSYLRRILAGVFGERGTTAWDFEQIGTVISRNIPDAIAVPRGNETERPMRVYYTSITRGEWDRRAVEWLKRDVGIEVDTTRGFMPE